MNFDILAMDQEIQKKFQDDQKNLEKYKKNLSELELTLKNCGEVQNSSIMDLKKSIGRLTERINNIENNVDYHEYLSKTEEILSVYRELLKKPAVVSFMNTGKDKDKEDDKTSEEMRIIQKKYLKIAEKYKRIENIKNKKRSPINTKLKCVNCGNKKDFVIEDIYYVCTNCYAQDNIPQSLSSSFKDTDRINITAKYTYDRKVHFKDCINQYQAKQNCTIEDKVYKDIEEALEKNKLVDSSYERGDKRRYRNVKKENIYMFLKDMGHSKNYENLNLIHHVITGIKPPDISHLEEKLLNDFDLIVETYDKLFKNKVERVNFISTQHVLYQLLLKHKHPCKKEDFISLKTIDRQIFHDNITGAIFSHLNWNYKFSL
jgi:hypothetical protein